jgi:hypothetical protein
VCLPTDTQTQPTAGRLSPAAGENWRKPYRAAAPPAGSAGGRDEAVLAPFAVSVFSWLVLQGARALVLFVFEPSNVFLGIGEAFQACFEDGGIGDLM